MPESGRGSLAVVIALALGLWIVTRPWVWYFVATLPWRIVRGKFRGRR